MKSRISQIALRIALIEEEFSQAEIREAVKLVEEHRPTDALLRYLGSHNDAIGVANVREPKNGRSHDLHHAPAVLALEQTDPEKFEVLSQVDVMIRNGQWLPHLDDIKRLATQLSKNFVLKKSRRESINPLIALLADLPVAEIRQIRNDISSKAAANEDGSAEYRNLARFIVTGEASQRQAHTH